VIPIEQLNVGSLCSGIGGFELGLERTGGFRTMWNCEISPYQSSILKKIWPDVPNLGDIFKIERFPRVDVIIGGVPCQPVSLAGRRKAQADDRWLWPRFMDAVRQIRPEYAILENVSGMLSANRGLAFGSILGDLAEDGYDAEWCCVSAAELGAPHLRYRVFLVAYPNSERGGKEPLGIGRLGNTPIIGNDGTKESLADPDSGGCSWERIPISCWPEGQAESHTGGSCATVSNARKGRVQSEDRRPVFRTAPRPCDAWAIEPGVGRVADGVPDRVDRITCLGNAIVPQVAQYIGERILEREGMITQFMIKEDK
jgi:DNA (cytosine-5)-methyltransferase 1